LADNLPPHVQLQTAQQKCAEAVQAQPSSPASRSPWAAHCRAPGPPLHIAPGSSSQCSRCPPAGHNEMMHQQSACTMCRALMGSNTDQSSTHVSRLRRLALHVHRFVQLLSPPQSSRPVAPPRGPTQAPCPRLGAHARCRAARVAGSGSNGGRAHFGATGGMHALQPSKCLSKRQVLAHPCRDQTPRLTGGRPRGRLEIQACWRAAPVERGAAHGRA